VPESSLIYSPQTAEGGIVRQSKGIAVTRRDIAAFGRGFGRGQSGRALFGKPRPKNDLIALTGRPCGVGDLLFLFLDVAGLRMMISGQESLKELKSILR
jgi:hypothetical protein